MQLKDLKILIVDDHMLMRNIVKQISSSIGLNDCDFASNGREALQKAGEENYNIILADWSMPEMTGLELLKALRADNKYNKIAFVMISAESESVKVMEAMREGATFYLTKPFSSEEFQAVLTKVLSWLENKDKSVGQG